MIRSVRGSIQRIINPFLMVLLLLAGSCLIPAAGAQAGLPASSPALLQRTAAGHVLGFQPDSLSVAAGDHVYRVEFAGASQVTPVSGFAFPVTNDRPLRLDRVSYPGLWPGISLFYDRAAGGIVRSTYLLEPGAEPENIRLRYNEPVHLEPGGSLRIEYATGLMSESAPVAWQDIDGHRVPVTVAFRIADNPTAGPEVSFSLGRYNPAYPLTIDPVLQWNTFLGGTGDDYSIGMALDADGNIYVTGESGSPWASPDPVASFTAGGSEAFVAKLDINGILQWYTFLGGSGYDYGADLALDGSGNIYVTGRSSFTWGEEPNRPFTPDDVGGEGDDAFAAKLNTNGELQWNTFLGGAGSDFGGALAIRGGIVYVAGTSANSWQGTSPPVTDHGGGDNDAFAASLDSSGVLQWNTFMGGAGDDWAYGLALDGDGNVIVVGDCSAAWGDNPKLPYSGNYDVFAAKLNSSGGLEWHTFLGGTSHDFGTSVAVDAAGNIYVGADSFAEWGTPVNPFAGNTDTSDSFVAKLNTDGVLQWHSFVGGPGYEANYGLTLDGDGNVYIAGESSEPWGNPLINFAGGMSDGFIAKLDGNGVLQSHTFLGGPGLDYAGAVAVDDDGMVYLAGGGTAPWGSPVRPFSGGFDGYVAKLHLYKFPWAMFLPALNQQQ